MLLTAYNGLDEESIRNMTHEELVTAVLRVLRVDEVAMQGYLGKGIPSDSLADAFRGRAI